MWEAWRVSSACFSPSHCTATAYRLKIPRLAKLVRSRTQAIFEQIPTCGPAVLGGFTVTLRLQALQPGPSS